MDFDFKDVLNVAGPTAMLLFASWFFLGYLNSRLSESQKRLNDLVQEFRKQVQEFLFSASDEGICADESVGLGIPDGRGIGWRSRF